MGALDNVVNLNISQSTQAVTKASFAIPAVYGPSNRYATTAVTGNTSSGSNQITNLSSAARAAPGVSITGTGIPLHAYILSVNGTTATISANATATATGVAITLKDAIRSYSSLAGMTSDGFLSSDLEYVQASKLIEQALSPVNFRVGEYSAEVAQVVTSTPDVSSQTIQHYIQTINGTAYDFTSDASPTAAEVVTGLIALINADSACAVTASGSVTLVLTAKGAGTPFTHAESTNLVAVLTTPSWGIQDFIAQSQLQDNTWYGCAVCSNLDADLLAVAAYIETQRKIFIGVTSTAAVATSSTTDVGSVMKGLGYKRSGLIFTATPAEGKESAWLGGQLPSTPGSNNWAYDELVGCTPDRLSDAQILALIGTPVAQVSGKNVNIYQTLGGVNVTQMGWMAGGQYIDITVGIDWLEAEIQTNVFQLLTSLSEQNKKVPYTDIGTSMIIQPVTQALQTGAANGLIDPASIVVTAPLVATVPSTQRANRVAPTITFSCRLQGAMNSVQINGSVTV